MYAVSLSVIYGYILNFFFLWPCFRDFNFFHQRNNITHLQTTLQAEGNWVGLPGQPLEVSSFETLSSLQEAMGLKAKKAENAGNSSVHFQGK
jgi:hypothetical protein